MDEVAHNVFHESSRLNSTWGGNIADMVRFTLYLEVIEKEGLVEKAAENGEYVLDKLVSLQKIMGMLFQMFAVKDYSAHLIYPMAMFEIKWFLS